AVTPDDGDSARLLDRVRAALEGGTRLLQYRNKTADAALRREQAAALCALCHAHGAALIVNDDLELALAVDADGLHLGGEDGSLAAARARLGPQKLLGASCYSRLENAKRAIAEGADHIAFGSFFVSSVKPGAVRSSPSLLTEAKRKFKVPVVAIGGITHDNAPQLIAAGADSVAVISALFNAPDIVRSAREFNALFTRHETKPKTV
ncbi:MAG TPA: thiamine phosphate synthase, partial [Burkholderiales bacterium]|nr:thiamine phosphate synthase [Burkholderiales bacterium]